MRSLWAVMVHRALATLLRWLVASRPHIPLLMGFLGRRSSSHLARSMGSVRSTRWPAQICMHHRYTEAPNSPPLSRCTSHPFTQPVTTCKASTAVVSLPPTPSSLRTTEWPGLPPCTALLTRSPRPATKCRVPICPLVWLRPQQASNMLSVPLTPPRVPCSNRIPSRVLTTEHPPRSTVSIISLANSVVQSA